MSPAPAERAAGWHGQFAVLATIWGASFLFIKVAVGRLPAIEVALARVSLGAAVLVLALVLTRRPLPRGRSTWGHLAVVALFGNALPFALLAYGESGSRRCSPASGTRRRRCSCCSSRLRCCPRSAPAGDARRGCSPASPASSSCSARGAHSTAPSSPGS